MIAEKILGNLSESTPSVEVDTVELDWFEAEKKRIRKTTACLLYTSPSPRDCS